jgi:Bax protein
MQMQMMTISHWTGAQLAAAIFLGCALLIGPPLWTSLLSGPPDFAAYPAGEARKQAFFDYLGPIIDRENETRAERRARLLKLRDGFWTKRDRVFVDRLADFYEVEDGLSEQELLTALLEHVDTIPRSLALAQAAKESAWGTSRFAVVGNNYFGQRCYSKGCGLVPRDRARGAKFEVRRFPSAEAAVASYMNNINGHREYAALRDYRARQRRLGEPVSGLAAAEQITRYSERRQAYVEEIKGLIRFNGLDVTR